MKKTARLRKTTGSTRPKKSSKKNAGKTQDISPRRVAAILERLNEAYPAVTCALQHENAFQLLIATILSAQCTDVMVNQVTPALFKKYPAARDLALADPSELEAAIRPTGFFRNKSMTSSAEKCRARWNRY